MNHDRMTTGAGWMLAALLCLIPAAPVLADDGGDLSFTLGSSRLTSGSYRGLQGGLIPKLDGKSLQGGGIGLGVPAMKADGKWYYPGSGSGSMNSYEYTKQFDYDRIQSGGRYVSTSNGLGKVNISYTVMPNKVRVMIRFDGLTRYPDEIRILNHMDARTFRRYEGSGLRGSLDGRTFGQTLVNRGCSSGDGDDTGYFKSSDRTLSFGFPCRDGWMLYRSRSTSRNISGMEYVIKGYVPHFSYDIYYATPGNSNRFWAQGG